MTGTLTQNVPVIFRGWVTQAMCAFRREFCVRGRILDLPDIAAFIESSVEQAGVDPRAHFDLQLAVEEACTNVIEHAYDGGGGELEVCFETRGDDVCITVRDWGRPFDPNQVSQPDLSQPLEERQIGGLGLYLMEKLMDEVKFTFTSDGNTLVMVKHGVVLPAGRNARSDG